MQVAVEEKVDVEASREGEGEEDVCSRSVWKTMKIQACSNGDFKGEKEEKEGEKEKRRSTTFEARKKKKKEERHREKVGGVRKGKRPNPSHLLFLSLSLLHKLQLEELEASFIRALLSSLPLHPGLSDRRGDGG